MTHKQLSLIKSWMRILGLVISIFIGEWRFGMLALIVAEIVGIYEEKYEDTIPVKFK